MTLWRMDITDEHKNEFDKKNSLLSDFFILSEFYKSKEYTAKYWSRCIENRLLKDLYQYIIKRTKPSSSFWECRDQNNLDALGNDTKTNFQKNIPGKVQFQKKKRVLPPPSTYPPPVPSSLGVGLGWVAWPKQCLHSNQKHFSDFYIYLEFV